MRSHNPFTVEIATLNIYLLRLWRENTVQVCMLLRVTLETS